MARMGMDVDGVEKAGHDLKTKAADIDAVVAQIDQAVTSLSGTWEGRDAQTFVNDWWPQHKKELAAASSSIAGLGQSALNNASEQRQASGDAGSSGAATGSSGGGGVAGAATVTAAAAAAGAAALAAAAADRPGAPAGELPPGSGRDGYAAFVGNRFDDHNDGQGGLAGECASWAAYRRRELGLPYRRSVYEGTGNGNEMAVRMGGTTSTPPTLGAIVSSVAPENHVMIVEAVNPDGSFRVSEMNVPAPGGTTPILGQMSTTRTFTKLPDGRWQPHPWGHAQSFVIAP